MKFPVCFALVFMLLSGSFLHVFAADVKTAVKPVSTESRDHGTWKEKRFAALPGADGIQRAEIVGGEYFYDPNYIVVKVNRPVEIKFRKVAGYIPHDLIVKAPEAGIDIRVDLTGEPQTVKFTPTRVGKYPMFCDKSLMWFKTHREKGMEGMIEVVE